MTNQSDDNETAPTLLERAMKQMRAGSRPATGHDNDAVDPSAAQAATPGDDTAAGGPFAGFQLDPPVVPRDPLPAVPTTPVTETSLPESELPNHRNRYCEVDVDRLNSAGFLSAIPGESLLAQEYRRIKRPLLLRVKQQLTFDDQLNRANLIQVTSSIANEGKTFVSTNLALSIAAEVDHTVLLIDADGATAGLSRLLGIPREPGLSDLLAGQVDDFSDCVVDTSIRNVKVLPAGAEYAHLDELFASDAMRRLMDEISERYRDRVVIIDSGPLLLTSESAVLARLVGQTVFVIQADRTPQSMVEDAIGMLPFPESTGIVLNRASRATAFGYGYGYGYGHSQPAEPAELE